MDKLPLHLRDGHLFVEIDGDLWLLDTGAPSSFGSQEELVLIGEHVPLVQDYLGLNAQKLSQFIGVPCAGLLGGDVLGRFDHIFDVAGGSLMISTGELSHEGQEVAMSEAMGIPMISTRIDHTEYRMFFDTGAQVSYFQDESLEDWPSAGSVTDFYHKCLLFLGRNIIISSHHGLETEEIVRASLNRYKVESVFRQTKDGPHGNLRPIRHWTDGKIRCHILCCIIAPAYLRVLELWLARAGLPLTLDWIMDRMRTLHSCLCPEQQCP